VAVSERERDPAGGEPLLLIHGLGASTGVWDPVVPLLAEQREVIVLDLPGFGREPSLPEGVEPSAANLAAALHERCLELGIERPHVAGNSLGGWVGLEMGRRGWAASVTALSPAGLWRRTSEARRSPLRVWGSRLWPLIWVALALAPLRWRALETFVGHPERVPTAAGRELVHGWLSADGYDGANRAMRSNRFDPTGYPEDVPVTIAWCELDRLLGPPKPERRPAGARFLVLPDVGHTPMWDDPQLVARTLLDGSARRVTSGAP
jgi:pimeloyl-ACP methyl ester carboxylesterase